MSRLVPVMLKLSLILSSSLLITNASAQGVTDPWVEEIIAYYLEQKYSASADCLRYSEHNRIGEKIVGSYHDNGRKIFDYEIPIDSIKVMEVSTGRQVWEMSMRSKNLINGATQSYRITTEGLDGSKRRTLNSTTSDGKELVKNGIVLGNSTQSPTMTVCAAGRRQLKDSPLLRM